VRREEGTRHGEEKMRTKKAKNQGGKRNEN
jgi:hypothetical protein